MPFQQSDLQLIDAAIASGARSVTIGDHTVIYNTGDSLIRQRELIVKLLNAELVAAQPTRLRRPKQHYMIQTGRGYD